MDNGKVRIYLSRECVSKLIDTFNAEIPAMASKSEAKEYESAVEELSFADGMRDAQGWIMLDKHTLNLVIAELDWAYCEAKN